MKYIIRVKRGCCKEVEKDIGWKIKPGRFYVRQMSNKDIYTSRRMATRFDTRKEALLNIEYSFEEAVKA